MKIDPHSPIYSHPLRAKRRTSSTDEASGFADMLEGAEAAESTSAAEAPARISPPPAVGGILSVQEVEEGETRRGRMIRRGHEMLDSLEELKLALLLGEVPIDQLEEIQEQMREEKELVNDPRLRDVMNQIEIRAAVELAKLGL